MADALAVRYGRTPERRRRGRIVAVVLAAAVLISAVVWVVWTGVGGSVSALEADTVAAKVIDDHTTEVRWQVTGRGGTALVCAIEARDGRGIVVGLVEQVLPASSRADRSGDTTVRTVRRAQDGLIASCRDA